MSISGELSGVNTTVEQSNGSGWVFRPIEQHDTGDIAVSMASALYSKAGKFPLILDLGEEVGPVVFFEDSRVHDISKSAVLIEGERVDRAATPVNYIMFRSDVVKRAIASLRRKEEPVQTRTVVFPEGRPFKH